MTKAGERLIRSAKQAVEIAKGTAEPAGLFVPSEIDVKAIRKKAGMSQEDFASRFGFSLEQVKNWEQSRSRPLGGNRAYLLMIDHDPKVVLKITDKIQKEQRQRAKEASDAEATRGAL